MIPRAPNDPSALAKDAPPLVVADLEGTCTSGETWRGVGRWLVEHGRRGRYRRFLAPRLAALPLVRLGVISRQGFRDRWIRDLARLLDGLTAGELEDVATQVVEDELWPKRRVAVVDALEAAAAGGSRVVIASGTYQPILAAFVALLAPGPAGHRVVALAAGAPVRAAYGDSLADVPLLDVAAEAVAVAPDRDLRPVAIGRGWRILDDPSGSAR